MGVAINAGTRDELPAEWGMAHFVEHLLFKGTLKRRSWHIINRLESVGGQLDAYTTKEDTFIYATVPAEHTNRALELIADVLFYSTFPQKELEKEKDVVLDEIQSYNDSPSELIYDDFEQALFPDDTIGRNILGSESSLDTFDTEAMMKFVSRCYTTDQIVLFHSGVTPLSKLMTQATKYYSVAPTVRSFQRAPLQKYVPFSDKRNMDTHQAHSIIGSVIEVHSIEDRLAYSLLNNILGGPNMSSLLNMVVRERHGLAYHIESVLTYYSDIAVWNIYFGCDEKYASKAAALALKELDKLTATPLSEARLKTYKTQLKGQVLIGNQNAEMSILAMAKSHLHGLPLFSDEENLAIIDAITPQQLQGYAQKLFARERLSFLTFV